MTHCPHVLLASVVRLSLLTAAAALLPVTVPAQEVAGSPAVPVSTVATSDAAGVAPAAPVEPAAPAEEQLPATPPAEVPTPDDAPVPGGLAKFFGPTTVSATADTYYEYNSNRPSSGVNALRNFDEKDNQFSLSYLELAIDQTPTEARRFGFRADLGFGPTATVVASADPDEGRLKYLQQGYASYLAPIGRGVQFDAGKFVTPAGAELIETSGNWNYSRSLLFAWAAPYYHVGVRAAVPVHDKVTVTGFLVNGWSNAADNNRGKTIGGQVAVSPTESLSLTQTWLGGPEQPNGDPGWRHLFDTVATWDVHPRLSLMGNLDIGRDRVLGDDVSWHGLAGYARYQVLPSWHVTPRFEWYEDAQGYTTGAPQTLREFTLTSAHALAAGFSTRLEYRRDWSTDAFFAHRDGAFRRSQHTFLVGFIYAMQSQ